MDREREAKSKKKLMKYLPRAASALSFQNPHFSPGRDSKQRAFDVYKHRAHAAQNRGFSGPLISLVPTEARANNRAKERSTERANNGFDSDVDEPRSPKVSCIGQIKQKKKLHKLKREKSKKLEEVKKIQDKEAAKKKPGLSFGNIFLRKGNNKKSELAAGTAPAPAAAPPGLNQMKRFSSGRDAFANFDWTKQVAPLDFDKGRECFSDDDEQRRRDWDEDEEEEEESGGSDVIIPFSAPLMIGGRGSGVGSDVMILEPRKEINLWKKRNMAPPRPLKLNSFR